MSRLKSDVQDTVRLCLFCELYMQYKSEIHFPSTQSKYSTISTFSVQK
jgi:hypothetical protein